MMPNFTGASQQHVVWNSASPFSIVAPAFCDEILECLQIPSHHRSLDAVATRIRVGQTHVVLQSGKFTLLSKLAAVIAKIL
jgi:hypothetical protein